MTVESQHGISSELAYLLWHQKSDCRENRVSCLAGSKAVIITS